ncbi:MAG: DUF4153 domain-containing protein [Gemmatimonadota bacterium]
MNDRTRVPTPEASMPPAALPVRAVLATGLGLGVAGDVLLRGPGGPGVNVFLLFVGLGAAVWALSRRARLTLSREALLMMGIGIALATTLVVRGSEALRFVAFLAAGVAFALPAFRAGGAWLRRSGVSRQVEAVLGAGMNALAGSFRLIGATLVGPAGRQNASRASVGEAASARRHTAWAVLRGVLLAIPFLFLFGALFMSADRMFSDLVTDVFRLDFGQIASHLVVTLVLTWLACGYLTGFLTGTHPVEMPGAVRFRPRLGLVEIGVALLMVDLLFAAFVGVQFRYLFGGSAMVEVTPGLTYAEYVREGFGQLMLACALVLPPLLAADWLLDARGRRDALAFRVLGGLLLLLLVMIIASAFQRVHAYQAVYGLTEPRFYGALFLVWLTLLTAWFAATVLRGHRERFAFPALVSGFAFVAFLVAVNPDVRIARTNLERAADVPAATEAVEPVEGVDAAYLASLGADAVPVLMAGLADLPTQPRCVLARGLLERWGPDATRESDWRHWNWPESRAREVVGAGVDTLRAMAANRDDCPPDE